MSSPKIAFATAATAVVAILGALASTAAHARGGEVQWSVTVGMPAVTLPVPVLTLPVPGPVVVAPAPRSQVVYVPDRDVPVYPAGHPYGGYRDHRGYREPTRWDVDGDGIPNRHDRLYNPVWDRNGNGVPDRREARRGPYGDRDRDGIPNRYDRHDDRWDRRGDRHDDRYDDRREWREWRGPQGR